MRRAVFLDRDGTVIYERHYLSEPGQVELIPGVGAALRALRQMGLCLVVVTNQSAIGRGLFDEHRLKAIHRQLGKLLEGEGVRLDGIYHCPHAPEEGCLCRKPRPGLIERAARDMGTDPRAGFVIGDKPCDMELGRQVGATTFLVRTGYGAQMADACQKIADHRVDDLQAAVPIIANLIKQAQPARRAKALKLV